MTLRSEDEVFTTPIARTLSEQVAGQLRQAILLGRLRPGQRIVEQDIAGAMSISRGPVRDALRILQNERLVVLYPHRGAFVAWLTLADAEEIYSLRAALEELALEYAVKNAGETQIEELSQVVDRMTRTLQGDYDQAEATELDLEFHHTLCRISGHHRLLAAWTALRDQVRLLIMTHRIVHPMDFRENAVNFHRLLVDAIRARELETGREQLRAHLAASFETSSRAIQERGPEEVDSPLT